MLLRLAAPFLGPLVGLAGVTAAGALVAAGSLGFAGYELYRIATAPSHAYSMSKHDTTGYADPAEQATPVYKPALGKRKAPHLDAIPRMQTLTEQGTIVPTGPEQRQCVARGVSNVCAGDRKRNIRRLHDLYVSRLMRWQSVSTYDKPNTTTDIASLPLCTIGGTYNTVAQAGVYMPVYLFNLTQPGRAFNTVLNNAGDPTTSLMESVPCHRLFRLTNGGGIANSAFKNYQWIPQNGFNNTHNGIPNSDSWCKLENREGEFNVASRGVHDWTSLDFVFYAPVQRQCKIHLYEVSFDTAEAGPERRAYNTEAEPPAVESLDDFSEDPDVYNSCDEFWNVFLAKKIGGPLTIVKNNSRPARRHMTIYRHEVMCLTSRNTLDADARAYTCNKRLFYPGGRMYNFTKPGNDDNAANLYMPVGDTTTGLQKFGYDAQENTPFSIAAQPDPTKEKYLLVVAEQYDQVYAEGAAIDGRYTPTFDVVYRQKYTWPNTSAAAP